MKKSSTHQRFGWLAFLAGLAFILSSAGLQAQSCHADYTFSAKDLSVSFTDSSYAQHFYRRTWSFGDGHGSDARTPVHTYAKSGTYTVCLKIVDTVTKCSDSVCKTVTVTYSSCHALYNFSVKDLSVSFHDSSSAEHFYRRAWVFGDGGKSDSKTPVHTYSTAGTYKVCLTITDTVNNCSSTYCESITVGKKACSAEFHFVRDGHTVKFYSDSTNSSTTVCTWSFGDGTSKKDRNATHTYSKDSTYKVCLEVSDSTDSCSAHFCKDIEINEAMYSISGKVTAGGNPAYPGMVWLITFNAADSSLKAVRKTEIHHDSTGAFYEFDSVKAGTYYVKAALGKKSTYYSDYLPTYHNDALKWKTAVKVSVTSANVSGVDVKLRKGTNPGGKGFIGGKISQGANKEGDPMADVEVMILDENDQPVAYTYSDSSGTFSVSNLALGRYQVYAEIPGLATYPAWVELTDAGSQRNDVKIEVNSTAAYTSIFQPGSSASNDIKLYPNPVRDQLILQLDNMKAQQATIILTDITGKQIRQQYTKLQTGSQSISLETGSLAKGVYLLKVRLTDGQVLQSRFVQN